MANNTQGVKGVRATAYDEMCAYDVLPLSARKVLREAPINFSCIWMLKSKGVFKNTQDFSTWLKKRASDYMANGQGSTRNIYGPTHPQAAP